MREYKAVYATKHSANGFEIPLCTNTGLEYRNLISYRPKTLDIGCQCETYNIRRSKHQTPSRKRHEIAYFALPDSINPYTSNSFTQIGVERRKAPKRKVRKVYLHVSNENGVGCSELSTYVTANISRPYDYNENKKTSSKRVGGHNESNTVAINKKLSPIIKTISATTSSKDTKHKCCKEMGCGTVNKTTTTKMIQVEDSKSNHAINTSEKSIENVYKEVKKQHEIINKERASKIERTIIVNNFSTAFNHNVKETAKRDLPSDSINQCINNFENSSKEHKENSEDPVENKIETEYRKVFTSTSKDVKINNERSSIFNKKSSILKRRFDSLRRGFTKKEESNKNNDYTDIISNNRVSTATHDKDVSINPESLFLRSRSNEDHNQNTFTIYSSQETTNNKTLPTETSATLKTKDSELSFISQRKDVVIKAQGDQSSKKQFNLDDSCFKPQFEANIEEDKIKDNLKTKRDEKKAGKKFFFFKKKNKSSKDKPYKSKKQNVAAGFTLAKEGSVLNMAGHVNNPEESAKNLQKRLETDGNSLKKEQTKKNIARAIESLNNVHVRWSNNTYRSSSSTILELLDKVYNQTGIVFKSKSDDNVVSPHTFHTNKEPDNLLQQNLEAFMIPQMIQDRTKRHPFKCKTVHNSSIEDSIELTISNEEWFSPVELLLNSKALQQLEKEKSSDYLRVDIPEGFFIDSSNEDKHIPQSSDEKIFKIVEYNTASENRKPIKEKNTNVTVTLKSGNTVVNKIPQANKEVMVQVNDMVSPQRCDVGVGSAPTPKSILKMEHKFSEEDSDHIIDVYNNQRNMTEEYWQGYHHQLTVLGFKFYNKKSRLKPYLGRYPKDSLLVLKKRQQYTNSTRSQWIHEDPFILPKPSDLHTKSQGCKGEDSTTIESHGFYDADMKHVFVPPRDSSGYKLEDSQAESIVNDEFNVNSLFKHAVSLSATPLGSKCNASDSLLCHYATSSNHEDKYFNSSLCLVSVNLEENGNNNCYCDHQNDCRNPIKEHLKQSSTSFNLNIERSIACNEFRMTHECLCSKAPSATHFSPLCSINQICHGCEPTQSKPLIYEENIPNMRSYSRDGRCVNDEYKVRNEKQTGIANHMHSKQIPVIGDTINYEINDDGQILNERDYKNMNSNEKYTILEDIYNKSQIEMSNNCSDLNEKLYKNYENRETEKINSDTSTILEFKFNIDVGFGNNTTNINVDNVNGDIDVKTREITTDQQPQSQILTMTKHSQSYLLSTADNDDVNIRIVLNLKPKLDKIKSTHDKQLNCSDLSKKISQIFNTACKSYSDNVIDPSSMKRLRISSSKEYVAQFELETGLIKNENVKDVNDKISIEQCYCALSNSKINVENENIKSITNIKITKKHSNDGTYIMSKLSYTDFDTEKNSSDTLKASDQDFISSSDMNPNDPSTPQPKSKTVAVLQTNCESIQMPKEVVLKSQKHKTNIMKTLRDKISIIFSIDSSSPEDPKLKSPLTNETERPSNIFKEDNHYTTSIKTEPKTAIKTQVWYSLIDNTININKATTATKNNRTKTQNVYRDDNIAPAPVVKIRKKSKQKKSSKKYEADILQSHETKKAVLKIYTQQIATESGNHKIATLPKFLHDLNTKIEEELSDEESGYVNRINGKQCELANSILEDYYRHWTSLGINTNPWYISNSKKSINNLNQDVLLQNIIEECRATECSTSSYDKNESIALKPHDMTKNKVTKTQVEDENKRNFISQKDSILVYKKRQLYASSLKSQWKYKAPGLRSSEACNSAQSENSDITVIDYPKVTQPSGRTLERSRKNRPEKQGTLPSSEDLNKLLMRQLGLSNEGNLYKKNGISGQYLPKISITVGSETSKIHPAVCKTPCKKKKGKCADAQVSCCFDSISSSSTSLHGHKTTKFKQSQSPTPYCTQYITPSNSNTISEQINRSIRILEHSMNEETEPPCIPSLNIDSASLYNTTKGVSSEDEVVFVHANIDTTHKEPNNIKSTLKCYQAMDVTRDADILQSYESKKAVLKIYTQRIATENGDRLVAFLPKFLRDLE